MTKKSISKQKNLKDLLQYFETFRSKMAKIKVFGASVVASLGLSEALLPFHFDIFNKTCVSHCTEEMTFKWNGSLDMDCCWHFQIWINIRVLWFLPDYRWGFPMPASHFVRDAEPAKQKNNQCSGGHKKSHPNDLFWWFLLKSKKHLCGRNKH